MYIRYWCRYVKYIVGYRNLRYKGNIRYWRLNLGEVRVLMFFNIMRLEGEVRGYDMYNIMNIFIKFYEVDNVYNWDIKIIFLLNFM